MQNHTVITVLPKFQPTDPKKRFINADLWGEIITYCNDAQTLGSLARTCKFFKHFITERINNAPSLFERHCLPEKIPYLFCQFDFCEIEKLLLENPHLYDHKPTSDIYKHLQAFEPKDHSWFFPSMVLDFLFLKPSDPNHINTSSALEQRAHYYFIGGHIETKEGKSVGYYFKDGEKWMDFVRSVLIYIVRSTKTTFDDKKGSLRGIISENFKKQIPPFFEFYTKEGKEYYQTVLAFQQLRYDVTGKFQREIGREINTYYLSRYSNDRFFKGFILIGLLLGFAAVVLWIVRAVIPLPPETKENPNVVTLTAVTISIVSLMLIFFGCFFRRKG